MLMVIKCRLVVHLKDKNIFWVLLTLETCKDYDFLPMDGSAVPFIQLSLYFASIAYSDWHIFVLCSVGCDVQCTHYQNIGYTSTNTETSNISELPPLDRPKEDVKTDLL